MKRLLTTLVLLALTVPLTAAAQVDAIGSTDTLYAELNRVDETHWSITVSLTNDEHIVAMSVPLKFYAEPSPNRLVADSAVYGGGRVETFSYKGFRADTAIQCVTLGMLANIGPTNRKLTPGRGRIVTVFISSLDEKPIEMLHVDTTTTHPSNSLQIIADTIQGDPPNTYDVDEKDTSLIPVFVARVSEAPKMKGDK